MPAHEQGGLSLRAVGVAGEQRVAGAIVDMSGVAPPDDDPPALVAAHAPLPARDPPVAPPSGTQSSP